MNQTSKFNVGMDCGGCPNALRSIVKRINKKAIGEIHANPKSNILTVQHTDAVTSKQIFDKLILWGDAAGKKVSLYKEGGRRTRRKLRASSRVKSRKKRRKSRRRKRRRKKRTKRRRRR